MISKVGITPYMDKKSLDRVIQTAHVEDDNEVAFLPGFLYPHAGRNHTDLLSTGIMDKKNPMTLLGVYGYDRYGKDVLLSKLRIGRWRRTPYIVKYVLLDSATQKKTAVLWSKTTGSIALCINDTIRTTMNTINAVLGCGQPVDQVVGVLKAIVPGNWEIKQYNECNVMDMMVSNDNVFKCEDNLIVGNNIQLLNHISKIVHKCK